MVTFESMDDPKQMKTIKQYICFFFYFFFTVHSVNLAFRLNRRNSEVKDTFKAGKHYYNVKLCVGNELLESLH